MSDPTPPSPESIAAARDLLADAGFRVIAPVPPMTDEERAAVNAHLQETMAVNLHRHLADAKGEISDLRDQVDDLDDQLNGDDLNLAHQDLIRTQALALVSARTRTAAFAASWAVALPMVMPVVERKAARIARGLAAALQDDPKSGIDLKALFTDFAASPFGQMLKGIAMQHLITEILGNTPASPTQGPVAVPAEAPKTEGVIIPDAPGTFTIDVRLDGASIGKVTHPIAMKDDEVAITDLVMSDPLIKARLSALPAVFPTLNPGVCINFAASPTAPAP